MTIKTVFRRRSTLSVMGEACQQQQIALLRSAQEEDSGLQ